MNDLRRPISALSLIAALAAVPTLSAQKPPFPTDVGQIGVSVPGMYIPASAGNDEMGRVITGAGDVNGDGIADFMIGAPGSNRGVQQEAGRVVVLFGGAVGVGDVEGFFDVDSLDGTNGLEMRAPDFGHRLGQSVAAVGDVNGDGYDDLLIGAPSTNSTAVRPGSAFLVFGRSQWPASITLDREVTAEDRVIFNGLAPGDRFGVKVAGLGDINNDHVPDMAIAATHADPNTRTNAGEVYVIHGFTTAVPSSVDVNFLLGDNGFRIIGEQDGDLLGSSLAGGSDIDGDGISDFLIGAMGVDAPGANMGQVYVFHGGDETMGDGLPMDLRDSVDGSSIFEIVGAVAGDGLGVAAAMLGDHNGDGIGDIVIGAGQASPNTITETGQAYLVYGRPGGISGGQDRFPITLLDGSNGTTLTGSNFGDRTGDHVAGMGDIDGDGRGEMMIGATMSAGDPPGIPGEAFVFFSQDEPFSEANHFFIGLIHAGLGLRFIGETDRSRMGASANAIGDIDGDGLGDYAVGAYRETINNFGPSGQVYVLNGYAGTTVATSKVTHQAGSTEVRWGNGPGLAGDPWGPVRAGVRFADGDVSITTFVMNRQAPTGAGLTGLVVPLTWEITTDRTGWASAEVSLHWTHTDVLGLEESSVTVFQSANPTGPWTALSTDLDTVRNVASVTGLSTLGYFAMTVDETSLSPIPVRDHLLGINLLSTDEQSPYDLNRNGVIDIGDLVILVNLG